MIRKKEFSNIIKQIILSNQKHKCHKCGIKFNVVNLPEFEYKDGNISNNAKTNLQVVCTNCLNLGKFQWTTSVQNAIFNGMGTWIHLKKSYFMRRPTKRRVCTDAYLQQVLQWASRSMHGEGRNVWVWL